MQMSGLTTSVASDQHVDVNVWLRYTVMRAALASGILQQEPPSFRAAHPTTHPPRCRSFGSLGCRYLTTPFPISSPW